SSRRRASPSSWRPSTTAGWSSASPATRSARHLRCAPPVPRVVVARARMSHPQQKGAGMGKLKKLTLGAVPVAVLSGSLVLGSLGDAGASSHREAPLITEDPVADNTDVYAFVSPDRPDTVTLAMNVIPFESPAGGPNFYKFGDDVLYA